MSSSKYDVLIIGAGVGGLVCGCYLARAGLKVLIIEKNSSVGGCCSSFKLKNHIFDSFAHSMGGIRDGSEFRKILEELNLWNNYKFEIHDPTDIIIAPDFKVRFWRDIKRTIDELSAVFPLERNNINRFIMFMANSRPSENLRLSRITYDKVLDEYFVDHKLKFLLSITVLGNAGLPPSRICAFTAFKLFQEFLLDGGVCPVGGMQSFADLLKNQYLSYGGDLKLSSSVVRILLNNGVEGVELNNQDRYYSDLIVSSCDATTTFKKFVQESSIGKSWASMEPSTSICLNYFATKNNVVDLFPDLDASVWLTSNYDVEGMYRDIRDGYLGDISALLVHAAPDKFGFVVEIWAPYLSRDFWRENKKSIKEQLLAKVQAYYLGIDRLVELGTTTTPDAIEAWTGNHKGAVYGWASLPSQFMSRGLTQKTNIRGLYLNGHWTTLGFGITGVANVAKSTALRILNSRGRVSS